MEKVSFKLSFSNYSLSKKTFSVFEPYIEVSGFARPHQIKP